MDKGLSGKAREERVNRLAGLGRIGQAIQGIISPGVAADTVKVESKLKGKFPTRERQVDVEGQVLPEATAAEVEDFIRQVRSFKSGAGSGPTGLKPQFLKDMVGEGGDDP
eukprot:6774434-Karenia_brevis.AAC.1